VFMFWCDPEQSTYGQSTRGRSDLEMTSAIHALGGQIQCASSREAIMYQSSHFNSATPLALSVIADTVTNPAFLPEEIESQRDATKYEIREISAKPEVILPEILHQVAYGGKGLGNPLLCPEDRVDLIDAQTLQDFMQEWYRPERIVIAGAGMAHEELVELADKHFSLLKSTESTAAPPLPSLSSNNSRTAVPPHLLPSSPPPSVLKSLTRAASYLYPQSNASSTSPLIEPVDTPLCTYTGGHHFIHDPEAELNHMYLAWEGVGIHSPDIYALATMQTLLGGGGSFSAGGPGKGMYSRLYGWILNRFPQIDHCESYHHIYKDSSLFGLFASAFPSNTRQGISLKETLPHLINQIGLLLNKSVPQEELSRAKNQLKSSLMMTLESRPVEVEDLGRQVLLHNRKIPVSEMCDRIDELTSEDILRVARSTFAQEKAKQATVVVMGREDVGDWRGVLRKYGIGGSQA